MIDLIDVPFGTRYVGYWEQEPVKKRSEVIDIINEHLGIDHIGISISTYKDGYPYLLFLPFDFDSPDLKESWRDAIKLYNKIAYKGYDTCLTFSGSKGFHVFIKVKPKVYSKRVIRYVQRMFKDMLSLKTMDEQIFGDVRRLMRIPNTYNMNGDLCKVISVNDGRELNPEDLVDDEVLKSSDPLKDYDPDENIIYHGYPCVEDLIKNKEYWYKNHPRGRFEPAQPIRYIWTIIRLSNGSSTEEIIKEAESYEWEDYDEDKTLYQINHIAGGSYVPHSCRTLQEMGFCTVKNCPHKTIDKEALKDIGIL